MVLGDPVKWLFNTKGLKTSGLEEPSYRLKSAFRKLSSRSAVVQLGAVVSVLFSVPVDFSALFGLLL